MIHRCLSLHPMRVLPIRLIPRSFYSTLPPHFNPQVPVAQVTVDWKGTGTRQFIGRDGHNEDILMSGSDEPGVGPMKLLLMALGGCSLVDFTEILRKQRQQVQDVQVLIQAQRTQQPPRPYKHIHMIFIVSGHQIQETKVRQAAHLATEKYCGVHATLSGTAEMTLDVQVKEIE